MNVSCAREGSGLAESLEWNRLPRLIYPPAPWTFADRMYGIAHCLVGRDGRVISCHLPTGNGALIAKAPAMGDLLRDLLNGVPAERLGPRGASIMRQIERHRVREPGDDDE